MPCYFSYKTLLSFIVVVIWNAISPWPLAWWKNYFLIFSLIIPAIIGIITTVWFCWGGIVDARRLFIDLKKRKVGVNDNGQVFQTDDEK
jgi:hypothetical protein